MENEITRKNLFSIDKKYSLNIFVLVFIYIIYELLHLANSPIYYFELMLVFFIFAQIHMKKGNAYVLVLTLPLLSSIIFFHPPSVKFSVVTFEISLKISLFYFFSSKVINNFLNALFNISASLVVCCAIINSLINLSQLSFGFMATPIPI